jgi:hypothetical protein
MAEFSTRAPLATYEQAIWRLAQFEVSARYTSVQLELAVQIVADMFWLSDAKILHDVKKAARSVQIAPRPRSHRATLVSAGA